MYLSGLETVRKQELNFQEKIYQHEVDLIIQNVMK